MTSSATSKQLEIRVGPAADALDRFEAAWNRAAEGRAARPLEILSFADLPLPSVEGLGGSRGVVYAPKERDRFSGISPALNQQTLEIGLGNEGLSEDHNAAALCWTLVDHAHGI